MILLRILSASAIELSTEQIWNKYKYKVLKSSTEDIYKLAFFQMKINKLSSENLLKYSWDAYLLKTIEKLHYFFFPIMNIMHTFSFFHKMCFLGLRPF